MARDFDLRDNPLHAREFAFLAVAMGVTWLGNEFPTSGGVSPWFRQTPIGIPAHFILFFVLVVVLMPYVVTAPRFPMTARMRELGIFRLTVLAWTVIGFAIVVAIFRGSPELFADWRNLLITTITSLITAKFIASERWRRLALIDLAIMYGLLSIPTLIIYALGQGNSLFGVRTTVFDAPTLYMAGFAAITAAWFYLLPSPSHGRSRAALLKVAGITSSLLILLSFRRSFWVAWAVGLASIVLISRRVKLRSGIRLYGALIGLGVLIVVAIVVLGAETIGARLESFLPASTGQFSATNEDHLNDIVDAWHVVERDPILGLGIGSTYETNLIADWKTESFEVHSAVLHVWLKFGIAGAFAYLAFHLGVIRAALKDPELVPIAAFLIGELAATAFGTWPYGSFQMSVFHGLVIALLVVNYGSTGEGLAPQRSDISLATNAV
ncbi:MAG TPA: O-antigen ligase family protein [Acidimicrobiia bacterium]|nr:O-antigen ligase family protein [Acidimicrobiia bacterium]